MKAERLFTMFRGRDADVYVNIEGTHIPVRSARYDPPHQNMPAKIVIGLDRLKVLLLLEKLKNRTGEQK